MTGDFFSLLAHISKDEDREVSQYLAEHLVDTALYAESRGKELGVGNICALIGLLHDAGKSLSEFQEYIQGKRDSGGDLKCTLFTGHPVRRVHFALYD